MTADKTAMIATAAPWGKGCLDRLQQLGWTVALSHDGIEALIRLADRRPAVFIIDGGLEDIDVQGVCKKLAVDTAHQDMTLLPVVDDGDSELSKSLQQLGLSVLDTEADIAAAVDGTRRDVPVSPSAARSSSHVDGAASGQEDLVSSRVRPLILLVDDDRDLLRALKLRFRHYDVDIETSTGGRQAVFKAIEVRPDVVVTDYSMPDGNAEYFIGQIREQPSLHQTPVIVLTGWTFEGGTDAAHQRDMIGRFGAVAYLQKPLVFDDLVAQLEEHCIFRTHASDARSLAS